MYVVMAVAAVCRAGEEESSGRWRTMAERREANEGLGLVLKEEGERKERGLAVGRVKCVVCCLVDHDRSHLLSAAMSRRE
jgi:hypothetical protein